MNAATHHDAPFGQCAQRGGHERTDGGKNDRRVELIRRQLV